MLIGLSFISFVPNLQTALSVNKKHPNVLTCGVCEKVCLRDWVFRWVHSPVDIGCRFGWQPYGLILLPLRCWKWNKQDWPPGEKKKTGSMKWKQWAQSVGDWVWRWKVGIETWAWSRRGAGLFFEHWSAVEQDIEPPKCWQWLSSAIYSLWYLSL